MVGRAAERDEIMALAQGILRDHGARLVLLTGEAGVGKSRIARWGMAEVERRALMHGIAAGYDVSAGGMIGGLRHAMRRLVGKPAVPLDPKEDALVREEWQWLTTAGRYKRLSPFAARST